MTNKHNAALKKFSNDPNGYAKWLIDELNATWPNSVDMDIYESLTRLANDGNNAIARAWLIENNLTGDLVANRN